MQYGYPVVVVVLSCLAFGAYAIWKERDVRLKFFKFFEIETRPSTPDKESKP